MAKDTHRHTAAEEEEKKSIICFSVKSSWSKKQPEELKIQQRLTLEFQCEASAGLGIKIPPDQQLSRGVGSPSSLCVSEEIGLSPVPSLLLYVWKPASKSGALLSFSEETWRGFSSHLYFLFFPHQQQRMSAKLAWLKRKAQTRSSSSSRSRVMRTRTGAYLR